MANSQYYLVSVAGMFVCCLEQFLESTG